MKNKRFILPIAAVLALATCCTKVEPETIEKSPVSINFQTGLYSPATKADAGTLVYDNF